MKVKRIDLDDEEMPATVTVEMTHDEAVYVALMIDRQSGSAAEEVIRGGNELSTSVYEGLAFGVFNRFYQDGVAGAAAVARGRQ